MPHEAADAAAAFPLASVLENEDDLRAVYRRPRDTVVAKNIHQIDDHFRRFIGLSPFLCMGTTGADGRGDTTPRGGEPGFVHVLDSTHLAMPDRPGNNRIDSLVNIVERPGVGLVFLIPGFEDALRVNGTARITTDEALMSRFIVDGKPPLTVIVITVHEAYLHCGKAVRRAGLWDAASQVDRGTFPSAGQIYRDQLTLDAPVAAIDEVLDKDLRDTLY